MNEENMTAIACTCLTCGRQFAATVKQDYCGLVDCVPVSYRVELYAHDETVTGDTFPVMLLQVPHFPPYPGKISHLVNPSHTAVIACRDFPDDIADGWAFCDLDGAEKTAIGEALVEHEAEYGQWYQALMFQRSPPERCEHGRGWTDYCEPCGRINGG